MFSVSQSGTVGDSMELLKWRGSVFPSELGRATTGIIRVRPNPLVHRTPIVKETRGTMAAGVSTWKDENITDAESRNSWIYFSSGLGMSGFNRYIQKFIENNPQKASPWNIPSPE
jgi:hypothetical protein